jgi:hypothetical protein
MKAQILKIAGVKTEAEFYKKFPSEEAFMKKHGKELEKAQNGLKKKFTTPDNTFKPVSNRSFTDVYTEMNSKQANQQQGTASTTDVSGTTGADKLNGQLAGVADLLGPIVGGIQDINQGNRDIQKMNAYANIADVVKLSSSAQNNPQPKKYDYNSMRSQTVNPMGVGTNYLQAEDGAEIQNTYDPLDIYAGLGYEPLNDSNVKQFQTGGKLNLDPFSGVAGTLGGNLGSATGKGTGRGGAASSIGSSLGGVAGNLLLPGVGGALGSLVGGFAGGLIDSGQQNELQMAQDKLTSSLNKATMQSGAQAFQSQNSSFMEDGGWVSNDWMPQTITKFGDYSMDQLLAPPHDADMLRSGGHLAQVGYTAPSARAMYTGRTMDDGGMMHSTNMMFDTDRYPRAEYGAQMAMGGDLQVHRGSAETLSYNPFLPNGGETVMFRGPSHDDGGMPISFGENGVEVEGGEPAAIMKDGGKQENLVVYGNMIIPNYGADELGDKKAKGKKFKHYVADLSKIEAKQNKIIDRSTKMVDNLDVATSFDKLSLQAAQANIMGATAKLKEIAEKKKIAAHVQNAILDTAEEYGIVSDALAKGKIVEDKEAMGKAMYGAKLESFKGGGKKGKAKSTKLDPEVNKFIKTIPFAERKAMAKNMGIPKFTGTPEQNTFLLGKTRQSYRAPLKGPSIADLKIPTPSLGFNNNQVREALTKSILSGTYKPNVDNDVTGKQSKGIFNKIKDTFKDVNWNDQLDTTGEALSSLVPFIRPTSQQALDPSQLLPEMMALSQNQLEPVQAQLYNPMLQAQPYRVSLQDQRNEVIAQQRAAERMAYGNPAAAAMIAAGSSDAINKINAEEFRANQAESMRAAETNRAEMNDAQMKNLAIMDQQYARQSEAKSKTKTQAIEVAKSVADKIAQNKLENRKQATMENMYPAFSFTKSGTAYKNPAYLAGFAPYGSGKGTGAVPYGMVPDYEADDSGQPKVVGWKVPKEKKRNGAIVKAIKNL